MKKPRMPVVSLQCHVQNFFEKHLTFERNASRNTILAYRDCLKLFLGRAAEQRRISVDQLDESVLDLAEIVSFLDWLANERNCAPRTRNQRLAALKAFARYLGSVAPEHLERCRRIRELRPAAFDKPEPDYLDVDEFSQLLKATVSSRRDRALLLLLYNTGARVQELVDLDLSDLRRDPVPIVTLEGKGRKQRTCPLWDRTLAAIDDWLKERGETNGPLFLNRHNRRLTRSGVAYILNAIANKAQLEPRHAKRITPHVIRHTTAMHLLQSNVDITTIAAWLGHSQLDTTHAYIEINLRMKIDALAAAELPSRLSKGTFPKNDLLNWLAALGRSPTYVQPNIDPRVN
jgi:site-specific recombinase XerD